MEAMRKSTARSYVLRGDITLDQRGRSVTVSAEAWASGERWMTGLDSMCQYVMVDREAATETGSL